MISPRKVAFEAKKREKENLKFRTFLKCNAEEKDLDNHFKRLHEELFETYDCNRCRNCCKSYHGVIPKDDIESDASFLNISAEQFKECYLGKENEDGYETKHKPCDFLMGTGVCRLGECKPDNCKKYPYTNQPERLHSLYGVLDVVGICPVAYEIYERLKKEYHFR